MIDRPQDRQKQPPAPLFVAGDLKAAADARAGEQEPGQPGKCRSCGADVIWAKTESGKNAPFDAKTVPGLFIIDAAGVAHSVRARVSHFATCANANQHRKPA